MSENQKEKCLSVLCRKLAAIKAQVTELAAEGYTPEARQKMRLASAIEAQIALLAKM